MTPEKLRELDEEVARLTMSFLRPDKGTEPEEDLWQKIFPPDIVAEAMELWRAHGFKRDLALVDLFAGWAGISKGFQKRGFKARAFDRVAYPEQDFVTKKGLAIALFLLLRVKPEGVMTAGPQCSTWIFLSLPHTFRRSEGLALTGYDIPGCMEDGAWTLWRNSSAAVAAAAVAHPGLEKLFEFHYGIGPSGVRGSIRLVFRSTDTRILLFFHCRKNPISKKNQKRSTIS